MFIVFATENVNATLEIYLHRNKELYIIRKSNEKPKKKRKKRIKYWETENIVPWACFSYVMCTLL